VAAPSSLSAHPGGGGGGDLPAHVVLAACPEALFERPGHRTTIGSVDFAIAEEHFAIGDRALALCLEEIALWKFQSAIGEFPIAKWTAQSAIGRCQIAIWKFQIALWNFQIAKWTAQSASGNLPQALRHALEAMVFGQCATTRVQGVNSSTESPN
jgi:hypothetical protein